MQGPLSCRGCRAGYRSPTERGPHAGAGWCQWLEDVSHADGQYAHRYGFCYLYLIRSQSPSLPRHMSGPTVARKIPDPKDATQ